MAGFVFNTIGDSIRTNTHHFEVDGSRALEGQLAVKPIKILVLGIKLSTGTVAELVPKRVLSGDQASGFWGVGSQIAEMFQFAKPAAPSREFWGVGIDELTGGTAGTKTLTVTGTATADGTIPLYVAGIYVPVAISATDDQDAIATKIAAAIVAHGKYARMPYTAAAVDEVVTLTMRWKGVDVGDVRLSYNKEDLPAGVTSIAIADGVSGAGNPDIDEIITAIGGAKQYDVIINPWNDATNLTALEAELTRRFRGDVQLTGQAFGAFVGTHGDTTTFGNTRNSKFVSTMAANLSPTPHWIWAAVYGAVYAGETNPARPRQTLPLPGCLPAEPEQEWSDQERNLLLHDGLATHTVDQGGATYIERATTMYQTNPLALPDPTFLDAVTITTLEYLRYSRRVQVATRYPRHLAASATDAAGNVVQQPVGVPVVTEKTLTGSAIELFDQWAASGWVEAAARQQFIDEYLVQRDPGDVNRFQEIMPPDLMNQFRGVSGQIQFLL